MQQEKEQMVYTYTQEPHYYGDYVRRLFLGGSILILLILPFYQELIPLFSRSLIVVCLVGVILFAALINPRVTIPAALVDAVISAIAFYFFAYYAFTEVNVSDTFLTIVRQVLAGIFAFAFYFSVKTIRARFIKNATTEASIGHRKEYKD